MSKALLCLLLSSASTSHGFVPATTASARRVTFTTSKSAPLKTDTNSRARNPSATELNVWFFGGTSDIEISNSGDSCELVAVRIEKTSSNSRRIAGDIQVEAPVDDVWAILTDYDNLSTHVPNLVESRRTSSGRAGEQGDGQYKCRLYQEGAQKIAGFQFGASVTMDMAEEVVVSGNSSRTAVVKAGMAFPIEKKINFKCVESAFFSEFDGEWCVKATDDGLGTTVRYVVDVRPRGPVPVVALEWRIREDVPTNLRAVKNAAMTVGKEGVLRLRNGSGVNGQTVRKAIAQNVRAIGGSAAVNGKKARQIVDRVKAQASILNGQQQLATVPVTVSNDWDADETMAVYLQDELG